MFRLILSIIFLSVLLILIIFNTGNVASLNLFSIQIEKVPVIVIAITSFVAGALYALLLQVITYVNKRQKRKNKETQKEEKIKTENLSSAEASDTVASAEQIADKGAPPAQSEEKPGNKKFPFFGKRKQNSAASKE